MEVQYNTIASADLQRNVKGTSGLLNDVKERQLCWRGV